jgi:spore coat protein B
VLEGSKSIINEIIRRDLFMSNCWNYNQFAGQMDMFDNRHKSCKSRKRDRDTCINENFVDSLVGKCVKINRGGPDSIEGKLLAVKSDFYVVKTRKGVVYVAKDHVKSITETNGKKDCLDDKSDGNKSGNKSRGKCCDCDCDHKSKKKKRDFIDADNFRGVLRALNQTFVQVNTGGPEKVEGFLAQVCRDSILVVSGNDAVNIPIDHIRSIKEAGNGSRGNKSNGNKNNNKNNNNNNNDNNNNNNVAGATDNNKSGGNAGGAQGGNKSGGNAGGAQGGSRSGKKRANSASVTGARRSAR